MQADEDFLCFPYTTYLTQMEISYIGDLFEKEGAKLCTTIQFNCLNNGETERSIQSYDEEENYHLRSVHAALAVAQS
jgi:hypothetical protein